MEPTKIKKTDPGKRYRRVLSAHTLTGDIVRNPEGEELGRIDELMIDILSGRVAYAVLSFGGLLGMGGKLFPIPLTSLSLRTDRNGVLERAILNVDKETIQSAPGFDRSDIAVHTDRSFLSRVYSHYGVAPYWGD